jgi:ribonuclease HII
MAKMKLRRGPTFELEAAETASGNGPVAGIDEAGRGPWAGPVVAAAVILDPRCIPAGLDDSKTIDAPSRAALCEALFASGAAIGVGVADVERIDRMNILNATFERHKGYGTPEHAAALEALGVTVQHRRSFRPVRRALERVRI